MTDTAPLQGELFSDFGEALAAAQDKAMGELEEMIPVPVGYHILIKMPEVEETFGDTGLVKTTETMRTETILSMVGLVLDMGGDAYKDETKFPNGAWCAVGDYVMFRANSGTRFKVQGQEYRLLNDDSIEAVVNNPNGITKVV